MGGVHHALAGWRNEGEIQEWTAKRADSITKETEMKKISKDDLKERDRIQEQLDTARAKLQDAIDALQAAEAEWKEAVDEAENWRARIAGEMEAYWDERSEKWQEGEKGVDFNEWFTSWNELTFEHDEFDVSLPEEIDLTALREDLNA